MTVLPGQWRAGKPLLSRNLLFILLLYVFTSLLRSRAYRVPQDANIYHTVVRRATRSTLRGIVEIELRLGVYCPYWAVLYSRRQAAAGEWPAATKTRWDTGFSAWPMPTCAIRSSCWKPTSRILPRPSSGAASSSWY